MFGKMHLPYSYVLAGSGRASSAEIISRESTLYLSWNQTDGSLLITLTFSFGCRMINQLNNSTDICASFWTWVGDIKL